MKLKAIMKTMMLVAIMFSIHTGISHAALITGDMGLTGSYSTSGGTGPSDDTILELGSVTGTSGTGDIASTVTFGTVGTIDDVSFSFAAFSSVADVLTIGGWQLDLTSLTIVDQTASVLTLSGTGILSGNAFESTVVDWDFSGNVTGSSYSMTVTAVPVPAAVWLFGSGLLGLIGVARRKAS